MKRFASLGNWFDRWRGKGKERGRGAGRRADLRSRRGTFELLEGRILLATWYVNAQATGSNIGSSWNNAYISLQSALTNAAVVSGDQVWVATGVYSPGSLSTSSFVLKNGVKIYGGFAGGETSLSQRNYSTNVTILSGGANPPISSNSYHVVADSSSTLNSTTTLDGFTIQNGYASGAASNAYGAGIYLHSNSSPTLNNLIISGNTASLGGGLYNSGGAPILSNVAFIGNAASTDGGGMYNTGGAPVLGTAASGTVSATGVTFSSNTASLGGGMYDTASSPTLLNVTFNSNVATGATGTRAGGGMYNVRGTVTLTNVVFSANSVNLTSTGYAEGGGMYDGSGTTANLSQVTFSGNSASATSAGSALGGGLFNDSGSTVALTNGVFARNVASNQGGGMSNSGATLVTVMNNTFDGNSAQASSGKGGGIYNSSTPLTVTNTILWGDTAASGGAEIYAATTSPATNVSYSIVPSGGANANVTLGTGIGTSDPLFLTAAPTSPTSIGDPSFGFAPLALAIEAGSPAVDNATSTKAPAKDVLGFPRPSVSNPDGNSNGYDIGAYQSQSLDVAPVATGTGGPYSVDYTVSPTIQFSGSATTTTSKIKLYQWDTNYNGTTFNPVLTGASPTMALSGLTGPGPYTIALRVYDEAGPTGLVSNILTTTLTVTNLPAYVTSLTTTPANVTNATVGNNTFSVSVTYSATMAATAPSITFTPSLPNSMLAPSSGSWDSGYRTYTALFNVSNATTYSGNVGITVSGAVDGIGNTLTNYNGTNNFHMDTVTPTVTSLSTSATKLTDSNGGGTFTVTATYSGLMSHATNPTITFAPSALNSNTNLSTALGSAPVNTSWADTTFSTFTATYNVTTDYSVNTAVDITVSGAQNVDFNPQASYTQSGVFTIDMTKSTASVLLGKTMLADTDAGSIFTLSVAYTKPMNTSVTPTISFSPSVGSALALISTGTNASKWTSSTAYTANYNVVDTNAQISNIGIGINGASDVDGNAQTAFSGSNNFNIDTLNPTVVPNGVSVNLSSIKEANEGTGTFTVTVQFSKAMKITVLPKIVFSPDVVSAGLLTFNSGSWSVGNTTYKASYSVAASATTYSGVGLTVSNAADADGNLQTASFTASSLFNIDTNAPTVTSLSVSSTTLASSQVGFGTFRVTVNYSEAMNTSIAPAIAFSPTPSNADIKDTLTLSTTVPSYWQNSQQYVALYDVTNQGVAATVGIAVSGAQATDTNAQTPYTWPSTFSVAMGVPKVSSASVSSAIVASPNVGSKTFTVTVVYASSVQLRSTAPTIAFTQGGSSVSINELTADGGSWNGLTYTAAYDVSNLGVNFASVGFTVSGVVDVNGNPQPVYTWPSTFNVDMVIPTVASLVVSPTKLTTLTAATNGGADQFAVTVTYNSNAANGYALMNTHLTPTIAFSPTVSGTLSLDSANSGWFTLVGATKTPSNTVYTAAYNVASTTTIATVQIAVSKAQDTNGNVQTLYNWPGTFSITIVVPTVSSVSLTPASLSYSNVGGKTFTVSVAYASTIQLASTTPTITFTQNGNPVSINELTAEGGSWNGMTYTAAYDVSDLAENFSNVGLTVSGVQDVNGNQQPLYTWSGSFNIILVPNPTTTTLSASAASLLYGTLDTVTATVTASSGTVSGGTVTFFNGTTLLGTAPLNSGTATLPVSTLPKGTDVLMASYSGGGNFAGSNTVIGANSFITTVAGSGNTTYNGDGIFATAAALYTPTSVAVDAAGDLFIADQSNNRVREVIKATGLIVTVAGNGTQGYSGDNGPATAAELYYPTGVAVDAAGNLFIADNWNSRIREVNHATGVITTVAGNGGWGYSGDNAQATAAELNYPRSVTLDAAGNLFIADQTNNRIREVNRATGVITTVAGNGAQGYSGDNAPATAAALYHPSAVAVDTAGNLFIADQANNRIREVNHATGLITTVAGNGAQGYSGDNGPATAAALYRPAAITIDAAGDLIIADDWNNCIREVNRATGTITTVAGNGAWGYSGDNGPAGAAELYYPSAITADTAGNLFIADQANNRIREVASGAMVVTVSLPGTTTTVDASSTAYGGDANVALTAHVSVNSPSTAIVNEGSVTFTILNGGSTVAVFNSATVSSGTVTDTVNLALLGMNAGIYSISAVYNPAATNPSFQSSSVATPGQLTIAKAPLTVTANDAGKSYGAADPTLAYAVSGTFYNGDGPSVIHGVTLSTTTGAAATAGTHPITATGGTATNYAITPAPGTLTVSKASLTATAKNASKVYGGTDPTLSYTPSGTLYYGDSYSVITGVALSTTTGAAATAGTHSINATGGTAANYAITCAPGTLSVSKATLTATADGKSKVYGGTDPSLTYTPSGTLYYNDNYSVIGGVTLSTTTGAAATAGTHAITATGGTAANYTITCAPGTLSVSKATLTATADDQNMVAGGAQPTLTYTPSGTLYYGDSYSVITGVVLSTTTGAAATVGTHPIAATGGTAANYTVTDLPGTLTVSPDPWATIASGAFFGPATTGLAWQNQNTGLVALWNNSGGVRTSVTFPGAPDPTIWKFLGAGDFNGDGTTDLLWQDQNSNDSQYGLVAIWLMDSGGSGTVKTFVFPSVLPPGTWKFLGSGNFAGNGINDLAWRDEKQGDVQNGLVGIWLMNTSGVLTGVAFPGSAPSNTWKLLGSGDFNHDGTADLAWQDQNSNDSQNGLVGLWLMDKNNPGVTSSITFPGTAPPTSWKLLGIGDFDGNGASDLAWQDQNSSDSNFGLVSMWLMNTSGGLSSVTFSGAAPPTSWKLLAIADCNQDGIADLLWQDQNTSDKTYGLMGIWLLNGGTVSLATFPDSIDPSQWQLTVGNVTGFNPPDLIWHNLATGQVLDWAIQSYGTAVHSSVLGSA